MLPNGCQGNYTINNRWGMYRHVRAVCACVAMEKMALFCGGMCHAREGGTTGESNVVCGSVVQASTARRAGGGGRVGGKGGRGRRGGGECF